MKYVQKKKVTPKHNCVNCQKVGFGKKIVSMTNAIMHGTRPKKYTCKFMAPGLTNYPGEGGKQEKWLISRETMNSMQNSFVGCPVVAETKHEAGSTPEDFDLRVKKGDYDGVITAVKTNAEDGWDYAEFIVWDPEVQKEIEKDGYNVSCAYNTLESLPGGVYNAIPYDAEVAQGEYIHMAIVSAPRQTGARIFLNSAIDKTEAGVIMFAMNGMNYKLYPKGKMNAENNEGGNEMKCKTCGEEKCNCSKVNAIDFETAVIETPKGDVLLKDMMNAYEAKSAPVIFQANADKGAPLPGRQYALTGATGEPSIAGGNTWEESDVTEKYQKSEEEARKKREAEGAKKNEETPEEKKAREEAESKKNADDEAKKKADEEALAKKNSDDTRRASRREALKEEGKTDEEIEAVMKSEAEAAEKAEKEKAPVAEKGEKEAAEKAEKEKKETEHFNSLANARKDAASPVATERVRISRSQSVKINKTTKEY